MQTIAPRLCLSAMKSKQHSADDGRSDRDTRRVDARNDEGSLFPGVYALVNTG